MKTVLRKGVILALSYQLFSLSAQDSQYSSLDSTGLPGDNFSLQGALEIFKSSSSPEEFEKKLNQEDNGVNNLDLNGDGKVDYIRVIDKVEGNAHAIVLQVPINANESQDIAVIEIEKNGESSAMLQIVGDEDIYGENAIVEPVEEKNSTEEYDKNKKGPYPSVGRLPVIVNVWFWPCVRFIYAPAYVVWVSPWYWGVYPPWWKPWKIHPWRWYYHRWLPYHVYYHRVVVHRVILAHKIYAPHRKTSVIVKTKYKPAHVYYKANKAAPYKKSNAVPYSKVKPGNAGQKTAPKSKGGHGKRK